MTTFDQADHQVFSAFVLLGIAAIFVASYFFESRLRLFHYVIVFCEKLSFPSSKRMAFFYAGLFTLAAVIVLTH